MKATRFMRKPFFVEAVEVTVDNMAEVAEWCQGHIINSTGRSFIRVPVYRATHPKQTEAYVGSIVTLSVRDSEKSFKVYERMWLESNFIELEGDSVLMSIRPQTGEFTIFEEKSQELQVSTNPTGSRGSDLARVTKGSRKIPGVTPNNMPPMRFAEPAV